MEQAWWEHSDKWASLWYLLKSPVTLPEHNELPKICHDLLEECIRVKRGVLWSGQGQGHKEYGEQWPSWWRPVWVDASHRDQWGAQFFLSRYQHRPYDGRLLIYLFILRSIPLLRVPHLCFTQGAMTFPRFLCPLATRCDWPTGAPGQLRCWREARLSFCPSQVGASFEILASVK
jgi:hypothetical protein